MAEKRKGCGFLIAALVATIVAGVIGFIGIKSGVDDLQSGIAESASTAVKFTTPSSGTFKADQDKDASVWLSSSDGTAPTKPTGYRVSVIDENGKETTSGPTSGTFTVMNQVQLATFPCKKGNAYTVSVTGLPEGSEIEVSHSSTAEALGGVGKAAGGFFGALGLGFAAFILGIIGLVRWLGSKPTAPAPTA